MRILCLHGAGTSACIFQQQTAAFRSFLQDPDQYQFDFIDAPHPSKPGPGIASLFSGPYYSFYRSYEPADVEAGQEWVLDRLQLAADQGKPYDALMCFSQGCAVAIGLATKHQNERPHESLPFRGIMFLCGGLPLRMLEEVGFVPSRRARSFNEASRKDLQRKAASVQEKVTAMQGRAAEDRAMQTGLWSDISTLPHKAVLDESDIRALPHMAQGDVFGLDMGRIPDALVPTIPTVHVYGILDPIYPSSIQLASFCRLGSRQVFNHGGGHEVPRTTKASIEIASLLQWLRAEVEGI